MREPRPQQQWSYQVPPKIFSVMAWARSNSLIPIGHLFPKRDTWKWKKKSWWHVTNKQKAMKACCGTWSIASDDDGTWSRTKLITVWNPWRQYFQQTAPTCIPNWTHIWAFLHLQIDSHWVKIDNPGCNSYPAGSGMDLVFAFGCIVHPQGVRSSIESTPEP